MSKKANIRALFQSAGLGCWLMLLAGCGADKPDDGGASGPPPAPPAPSLTISDAPSSGGTSSPILPDPLLGGSGKKSSDPLLAHDPLLGRAMPTDHSHWLRGRLRDARVTVHLNGMRQGEFSGVLDQDITMNLQPGLNRVTFLYTPLSDHSAANLEIVESEHDPPIPPLVTFNTADLTASDSSDLKPVTKSFTFIAN